MCRKIIKEMFYITQYGSGDELLQSHIMAMNLKRLPNNLKSDVELLKSTAAHNQILSLSSNQIRLQHRMFAILNPSLIIPGKWINYEKVTPKDYRVIINPVLVSQSTVRLKDFEQCASIPGLRFHVWNPVQQSYKYYSPSTKDINKDQIQLQQKYSQLKGFESRVWDHEVRHLQGILALDPSISHMQLSVSEDYQDIPAMHELAQNLKQQLLLTSQQNMMKMMKNKSNKNNKNKQDKGISPQKIPQKITKQMKGRMTSHFKTIKKMLQQQQSKQQK